MVVEQRRAECVNLSSNTKRKQPRIPETAYSTEFTNEIQTNDKITAYANISVDEGSIMTDQHHRQAIVMRRTDSFDSTDGNFSARNSMKYESEYECMSSPESFSNSSSNRSSNTSSFYGNISPDTLSLASFAGRLNFGRFTGSKRSSQSSNASSQDSGRQSWGKIRDSFDLSDPAASLYVRRTSSEQVYENTRPFTTEYFMRFPKANCDHMEVTDRDESPPPLPSRQNHTVAVPTKEPEMIMPYKVVDLDELQRSLQDIEPYYVHNGSKDVDNDFYNECSDPIDEDIESDGDVADGDFRPALPPKKKTLSHSQSDSCCKLVNAVDLPIKERPTPLPRHSLIISDMAQVHIQDGTALRVQTEESTSPAERGGGHQPRTKSLPSGRTSKIRQKSTSPQRTVRPMRSAPPPPPPRSSSPAARARSSRPVSEMFPQTHNMNPNSPVTLKRSMTVSILQSPFTRRKVDTLSEELNEDKNSHQISKVPPTTLPSAEAVDEKSKEDTGKSGTSKTGAFFGKSKVIKKALSTLKIPGTKKAAKKELAISPPSDFTSLYQTRFTTDYPSREQKGVSFLATDDSGDEVAVSDASAVMSEPPADVAEPNGDEYEVATEDSENDIDGLTFHPEFTELSTEDVEQHEKFYYNFPISKAFVNGTEKVLSPKKPPRSGYLHPSMSQRTIEQEEEISLNKLPELGPLPTPPEGSSSSISSNSSLAMTPDSDATPSVITENYESVVTAPENHVPSLTTSECDEDKASNADKSSRKPKPEVPRRPNTLKLKPKVPNRPVLQSSDKPTPIPRSLTLDTATLVKSKKSADCNNERRCSTPLEETTGLSRSCDSLGTDDSHDSYVTDMHLIVLKDILRCWRNLLRKPTIDLAGACWEDFEMVESESWPKISEDHSSVSLPVRLRRVSPNSDTSTCCRQFIAKIKCQNQANSSTKSLFDQDYSVCSSVESHENVSRVLAYFRGDIRSPILGIGDDTPLHTTISVSDQVPVQTCAEFLAHSKDTHSNDSLSYERTVCMLILQCLKGVIHLHDSGFTHGNLNLNNLFLIKHDHECQLLISNFGKSQPLAKERRASNLYTKSDDSPKQSSLQNDLAAISEILTAMLHQDQNGNGTHSSKASYSTLSGHLRQASERLRDGSVSPHHVIRFLQALMWGPFKLDDKIVIVSESRMKQWLERQRGEFIARLAMDEALARTVDGKSRKFSMEDLLLCEYLTAATPSALVRTEKRWFLAT